MKKLLLSTIFIGLVLCQPQIGDECITEDGDDGIYSCDMICHNYIPMQANQVCHNGILSEVNLNCPEFECDYGDCGDVIDGECIVNDYDGPIYYVRNFDSDETGNGSWGNSFNSIQHAIDVSVNGDTVVVYDGIYYENINFEGKNILVISYDRFFDGILGHMPTIIDGGQNGPVVIFENGEDSTAVLNGFTLQNGYTSISTSDFYGGGICCKNESSPKLVNLVLTDNATERRGGGISCRNYSSPIITNSTIINNTANTNYGSGGGIYANWFSQPVLENVRIINNSSDDKGGGIYSSAFSDINISNALIEGNQSQNSGGGICNEYHSDMVIRNVTVANNHSNIGGGIRTINSHFLINQSTIVNNTAESGGGAKFAFSTSALITNSIFWNNVPEQIFSEWVDGEDVTTNNDISIRYSDILGGEDEIISEYPNFLNWLEGNINADPLFTDPENGDFTLQPNSPCIDAGDPNSPLDPDGTVADMGAFYFDQSDTDCTIPGDVNGDGVVNVVDIISCVSLLIYFDPPPPEPACIENIDINEDGQLNILDIVEMVNIILEG